MKHSHPSRTLGLIIALHAFTHLYQVALLPLYLRIQQDLNLGSVEQATLLVTMMGVAYFGASYPMGALADRLSHKKLLAAGLAVNALGFVGLYFAPEYPMAVLCVMVAGLGGSAFHPAATSLVVRLFPEARGRALGLVGIGASVGFCLGPLYTGWRVMAAQSWRVPVLELGLAGLVVAGLFLWLAEETSAARGMDGLTADNEARGQAMALKSSPAGGLPSPTLPSKGVEGATQPKGLFPTLDLWAYFLAASLALSLRDFSGGAMSTASSLFLQNAHGFDPGSAGLALSTIFIASAISNPLFGRLSDSGRMRWASAVLIASAALISVFPRVPVGWMIPVLLVYGFFFLSSYPMTEAAVMEAVPDAVRGRVFGLFITVSGLMSNLSHWIVGGWVKRLGANAHSAASYLSLYGTLSLLVLASLAGLPCLRALRKGCRTAMTNVE